ncbi:PREDICTED: psoriasis susceptibility 1 candidate gene 1 protein [Galeopterus variegatus]|uniref:Psoriasis susceptibility 1 candidate gene 1 protein n=1 Tax=Galeopterus variegatus TaxID=482537 RepID=A0ABM0S9A1_GALVR|nr:PREDICTED: psoriasis susceptibility 1 candidate gene 1 protein [Galeopterus variegatus]
MQGTSQAVTFEEFHPEATWGDCRRGRRYEDILIPSPHTELLLLKPQPPPPPSVISLSARVPSPIL